MYDTLLCRGASLLAVAMLLGCGGPRSAAPTAPPGPAKTAAVAATPKPTTVAAQQTTEPVPAKSEASPGKAEKTAKSDEKRSPKTLPLGRSGRSLADELRDAQEMEDALRGK